MTPDSFNALFELAAIAMAGLNIRRILIDKGRAGVSLVSVFFCQTWIVWSCIYFSMLHQWLSLAGSILYTLVYAAWVGLLLHYGKFKCSRDIHCPKCLYIFRQ